MVSGAVTDENHRDITIDLALAAVKLIAIVYKRGKEAHWDNNPLSLDIEELEISSDMQKTFHMAAGGRLAISLKYQVN